MREIYTASNWLIKEEHLLNDYLTSFLDIATDLNCELWIDWWASFGGKPVKRFVLRAPSQEAVNTLVEKSGVNLGLTRWEEVSYEYFLRITKDKQVPNLQKMRSNDPHYFGRLEEGFSNLLHTAEP